MAEQALGGPGSGPAASLKSDAVSIWPRTLAKSGATEGHIPAAPL